MVCYAISCPGPSADRSGSCSRYMHLLVSCVLTVVYVRLRCVYINTSLWFVVFVCVFCLLLFTKGCAGRESGQRDACVEPCTFLSHCNLSKMVISAFKRSEHGFQEVRKVHIPTATQQTSGLSNTTCLTQVFSSSCANSPRPQAPGCRADLHPSCLDRETPRALPRPIYDLDRYVQSSY